MQLAWGRPRGTWRKPAVFEKTAPTSPD
jgi:hypothetical protein